jgi:tRNA dimethylallyltransferase
MVIIITGPTASGKSWLAEELARRYNGAIINADMAQFYTACSIGTAKPAWKTQSHKSYLFDWIDQPSDISVVQFRQAVDAAVASVNAAGKLAIIVGGSAFYIKSLFYQPRNLPHIAVVEQDSFKAIATVDLWDQLKLVDPARAAEIPPTDRYRIERAIIIWQTTGVLPSACKPTFTMPFPHVTLAVLLPDRARLEKRIRARTHEMIYQHGWIDEARKLLGTSWRAFIEKKGFVGYQDIFAWLDAGGKSEDLPALVTLIGTRTRQYAKRQEIFLKKLVHDMRGSQAATNVPPGCQVLCLDEASLQSVNEIARAAKID